MAFLSKPSTSLPARRLGLIASVMLVIITCTAQAAPTSAARIVVLQSRVGANQSDVADELAPLLYEELEAEGFAARPATIASALKGQLPLPGILDRGLTAADIMLPVELGYKDWARGKFAEAESKLVPALARIYRNPALLVADTKNLDSTFRALVALALSQSRLGKTAESTETMMELIRMFGSRPISRAEYGPPAEQLYQKVLQQAVAAGRGQLFITTDHDQAVIFVDGQIRGIGKAAVADLVPGTHHVLVQVASTVGRQYKVDIKASEALILETVWKVDMALAVTDPWIGLVFKSEADRTQEGAFAGELAKRWGGHGMVAVVSTVQLQGKPFLIGTLYRADGTIVRGAATSLEGDRRALLRSLAKYLADGTAGPTLNIIGSGQNDAPPVQALRDSVRQPTRWTSKLVLAAGGLAVAAGSIAFMATEADDFAPPTSDDPRYPAVGVMIGGSAVIGTGVYLWLRESRTTSALAAALVGAGAASMVAGGALFLTDEDHAPYPPPNEWQRETYRDSATLGVVVGAAGVALMGTGIWLRHRERRRGPSPTASGPTVSVAPERSLVLWTGRF
jgi:hypothetical protein